MGYTKYQIFGFSTHNNGQIYMNKPLALSAASRLFLISELY